ncbi:MAG: glutamyl-tRNA reductase [Desulfatitalea sp.]|nr:glutamyl-tRNA reductase [Desulfatitalea sp.]NNJ98986.1 glutamyl-tRNA reductase [Desulfatitalea sp.]
MDKLLLMGLNHKTAPVDIRECLAFTEADARMGLDRLAGDPAVEEALIVSTCNRVELLLVVADADRAVASAKGVLGQIKQLPLTDFEPSLYVHRGQDAIRHLFRVAASLDSMVVGEPQILGQMKNAYRLAAEQKSTGVILNRLLHRTFFTAKRIRTETGIGDHAVSISYAAIELARKIFGELSARQVLLIGAGEMAELAVEHLIRQHTGRIFVANRTLERAVSLATRYKGHAICMEEVADHLSRVDIIISSTGATGYVLSHGDMKGIMRRRRNRPLFFIDIAVPRDIDPLINTINNVYVYDIDDLNEVVDDNVQDRRREAVKAERIVDEAVIQFRQWYRGLGVVPVIKALRAKLHASARAELEKTVGQMPHFTEDDRRAMTRMMDALVNKILHAPTSYLKSDGCIGDRGLSLDITRKLFRLDE